MISTKQALKRAIDSAARKKCLDRPKYKAIEAAKQCLMLPNKENRDAADLAEGILELYRPIYGSYLPEIYAHTSCLEAIRLAIQYCDEQLKNTAQTQEEF